MPLRGPEGSPGGHLDPPAPVPGPALGWDRSTGTQGPEVLTWPLMSSRPALRAGGTCSLGQGTNVPRTVGAAVGRPGPPPPRKPRSTCGLGGDKPLREPARPSVSRGSLSHTVPLHPPLPQPRAPPCPVSEGLTPDRLRVGSQCSSLGLASVPEQNVLRVMRAVAGVHFLPLKAAEPSGRTTRCLCGACPRTRGVPTRPL